MKLLVLDSSGLVASVALIEDDQLIAEYTTGNKLTHSQTLLPMLDEVIKRTSFEIEDIDAVAVAKGPGSFTGLRIGAATAKGLGLALDKPIIPVPTVDGLAYQLFGTSMIICPMMDARRKQVYTGFYRFEGSEMKVLKEQCAQSVEDTLIQLREYNEPVVFLGDGVPVYKEEILEKMGDLAIFAPAHANRQRAAAVGTLAQVYFAQGIYESADEFVPEYLRKSQAEREREERLHGQSSITAREWHVRKALPEDLPMIGDKLEGPAVDFSHGDVNAHQPIPGSLETFVKHYCVDGTYQAYTEYRGKGAIREYLAEKLAEYSGAPVDPKTEIILTPGTQGALFLAMGSLVGRGDKVAIVEPDYFDNRKLVEFFEGEMVPIHMNWKDAAPHTSGIDLKELEEAVQDGYEAYVFFVVQMKGVRYFTPKQTDSQRICRCSCRSSGNRGSGDRKGLFCNGGFHCNCGRSSGSTYQSTAL